MDTDRNPKRGFWKQLFEQPYQMRFRRVLLKVHLWCGLILGLYIFFISLSGSVLVYRGELLELAIPEPPVLAADGPLLTDSQLLSRVAQQYPEYEVQRIYRTANPDAAADIRLVTESGHIDRFFDPRTGEDVGSASRAAMELIYGLMEMHKNFFLGELGLRLNGLGALAILLMAGTGLILWWPGQAHWRSGFVIHPRSSWRRIVRQSHSATGIWSVGFILMFAVSGIYLSFQPFFLDLADWIQPMTPENAGDRFVDDFFWWVAFLHFGRLNGIALPCDGPGLCDHTFKAIWALFGLAPAIMFATGFTIWWQTVSRRNRSGK